MGAVKSGVKKVIAKPKVSAGKTLRLGTPTPRVEKSLQPSDVRLKVRNIDEKNVSNDDLRRLFAKMGELKVCRFDRNEFGIFLGSATVTYAKAEDAKRAIAKFHGNFLDDKVLTVEYDILSKPVKAPQQQPLKVVRKPNPSGGKGKMVRI